MSTPESTPNTTTSSPDPLQFLTQNLSTLMNTNQECANKTHTLHQGQQAIEKQLSEIITTLQSLTISKPKPQLSTKNNNSNSTSLTATPIPPPQPRPSSSPLAPLASHIKIAKLVTFSTPTPTCSLQDWLFACEQHIFTLHIAAIDQVAYASSHLAGDALIWWRTQCKDNPQQAVNWSWDAFKTAISQQFTDDSDNLRARHKLNQLHQSNWTVAKYNSEFRSLLLRIHPPPAEEDKLERYYRGLNLDLVKVVALQRPATIEAAMGLADQADQIFHTHES
eukprot:Phypoly_transcript_02680.p1 GENE.Phypoly_transcript_02680~~Phypoly_transcript_02680.p1  ORF type:complete len:279 (+),score=41.08 Phypoly_transcript_02680:1807-2643(+)